MSTNDDFYRKLRENIRNWAASGEGRTNKYAEYLLFAPDLFHLLCKLTLDPEVPSREKAKLAAAVAYFISPLDLMPEVLLGPLGYADDIAVAAYVLNGMINRTDRSIVEKHWAGEGEVLDVIGKIIQAADAMIGSGLWKKLKKRFL